uniref:Apple domain-containing protein n=1 Tax=Tetranychus urticae TaxID=32264 RepID=T1KVC7_TETUR
MPAELPMIIEDGNWLIKAKLLYEKSSLEINIIEYVKSVNGTIRGKIDFKIDDDDVRSIFYTNTKRYNRLFFRDHYCKSFAYTDDDWSDTLPNLYDFEFLNHLLLVGPSVIFRIVDYIHVWKPAKDEVIRGFKDHAAKGRLDEHLDVWFYFTVDNYETGIKKPNQVKFYQKSGMYWFYIYTNTRVEQNFDTIVTPNPTAYCQQSAIDSLDVPHEPFPRITEHSIHFISKTKSFNAGPSKKEEVYADEKCQILNIKTPGLVQDSSLGYDIFKLDLNRLLNFDLNYRYFGPALFDERNGIGTHAWQISEEQAKVEEKTYPRVVTTQYFNKFSDITSGYTLIGTKINAYNNYVGLTASRATEYFFYGHEISSSESTRKFNLQNCYPDPASRKTIAMYFTCKDKVKESLVNSGTVAASRIANIEPIFNSNEIIIYITILDFPRIKNAFEMRNMKLNEKALTKASKVLIDGDEEDCLIKNSYKYEPFEAIAFCKTVDGNLCQRIDGKNVKLVEDQYHGVSCSVFMTPLKNLFRYSQEIPLENLHERLNHISISFISPENNKMFTFTPYHVTDAATVNDNEHDSLFDSIYRNMKLVEDKMKTISVTGATDSSSCYRKCANSNDNNCNSFSFCVYNDRVECLVSTNENVSSETASSDASCITYLIDNLQKFKKIPSKRFTDNQNTVSFDSSLGKCASLCHNSDLCKSFQFCSGSCSMAGQYTDAASDYSENCDIYIPKVLDRFEVTGTLIVEDVFLTEMNLNADQCAALCHDWNDKEVTCHSFNYCPANAARLSICQLSKYYLSHDADVKLVHSDFCQNYQRSKQSLIDKQKNSAITKSAHIGTIFGSIVLFAAVGLIFGVIVAIVINKFYSGKKNDPSESHNRHTISWAKQALSAYECNKFRYGCINTGTNDTAALFVPGHLNACLGIGLLLQKRGHQVHVAHLPSTVQLWKSWIRVYFIVGLFGGYARLAFESSRKFTVLEQLKNEPRSNPFGNLMQDTKGENYAMMKIIKEYNPYVFLTDYLFNMP